MSEVTPPVPFAGVIFWCAVAVGVALNLALIYAWDLERKYEWVTKKDVYYLTALVTVVDVLMVTAVLKVLS